MGKVVAAVIGGLVILFGGIFTACAFTTIESGEVGVVRKFGNIQEEVLTEGVNWRNPFTTRVTTENLRVRLKTLTSSAGTRDLQDVSMTFAVNYQIDPTRVVEMHRNIGSNFEDVVLDPAIQEALKSVTSQFSAEELVTKRALVSDLVVEELENRVSEFGLNILQVNIINLQFSAEFERAIEDRNVAEQRVRQAEQEKAAAQVRADQRVLEAEADAEVMRLLNTEVTDEVLQKLFLERWDGHLPTHILGDNPLLLQLTGQ